MEMETSDTENCPDWQKSCTVLKERGVNLYESRQWSDCEFVVGTGRIPVRAHKLIISMASPVFENLFFCETNEKEEPIEIPDIKPSAFSAMLNYIYTENIKIDSMTMAIDLYLCAKRFLLLQLMQVCSTYMSCNVVPENACKVYEIGLQNNEELLVKESLLLIKHRTKEVLHEDSFFEIDLSTIINIYSLDDLKVSEQLLFDMLYEYSLTYDGNKKRKENDFDESPQKKIKMESGEVLSLQTKPQLPEDDWTSTPFEWLRPALQKIRFLAFTPLEFASKVVSARVLAPCDAYGILANIASPHTRVPMPKGFSKERAPRYKYATPPPSVFLPEATCVLRVRQLCESTLRVGGASVVRVTAGGREWSVRMTPLFEDHTPRSSAEMECYLGFFIRCEDWVNKPDIEAKVVFTLLSTKTPLIKVLEKKFSKNNPNWGFEKFVPLREAKDKNNYGYLTDEGDIAMQVKIQVLSVV